MRINRVMTCFAAAGLAVLAGWSRAGAQPTFGAGANYATGAAPTGIVAADLDQDGDLDMAVANWSAGTITFLRNVGGGAFQTAATATIGASKFPRTVSAADLAGTAAPDVVVANEGGSVTLLRNDGGFVFTALPDWNIAPGSSQATAGDFDGEPVVVGVTPGEGDQMASRIGDGAGGYPGFDEIKPTGDDPIAMALGLFNADDKPDIAVVNRSAATVSIFVWTGNGNPSGPGEPPGGIFTSLAQTLTVGPNPRGVVVGRFNADALNDLAVACAGDNTVRIFLGTGIPNALFTPGQVIAGITNATAPAAADLDHDGDIDLVVTQSIWSQATLRSVGQFDAPRPASVAMMIGNDGLTACGGIDTGVGTTGLTWRAVRWTATGGRQELGTVATWIEPHCVAWAMSTDGTVIGGEGQWQEGSGSDRGFIWRASDGVMRDLKDWLVASGAPGANSWSLRTVKGISGDGTKAVGTGVSGNLRGYYVVLPTSTTTGSVAALTPPAGFTTTTCEAISRNGLVAVGQTGAQALRYPLPAGPGVALGIPAGYIQTRAEAVNSDGSVIAGVAITSGASFRAFRWTQAGGFVILPQIAGYTGAHYATAISDDGNTIVGYGYQTGQAGVYSAWKWTSASGVATPLAPLVGGAAAAARGVSPSGASTCGSSESAVGLQAFVTSTTAAAPMPGSTLFSSAKGVSADGTRVVGIASGNAGNEGFYLNLATNTLTKIADDPAGNVGSIGNMVANTGEVAATTTGSSGGRASSWTTAGGGTHTFIDLAGGTNLGDAAAIADAGGALAGWASSTAGSQAFRHSGGITTGLGFLAGAATPVSRALGISGNGAAVVGFGNTATTNGEAFRWTSGSGMVGLGDLAGGSVLSIAYDASFDGAVVVGLSSSGSGTEAFRWTSGAGMVGLGDIAGGVFNSVAYAVNGAGTLVTGLGAGAAGTRAAIWHSSTGMQDLGVVLAGYGVNMSPWQYLRVGYGISSTAAPVIVGEGANAAGFTQAYIATLPAGYPSVNLASDAVAVLRNGGAGTFAAPSLITVGSAPGAVALRDVNGDGRPDIVVTLQAINAVRVILNTSCPADWDRNGSITPADVAAFITVWSGSLSGGTLAGDFDGNGLVNPADVSNFINAWFAAVGNPC